MLPQKNDKIAGLSYTGCALLSFGYFTMAYQNWVKILELKKMRSDISTGESGALEVPQLIEEMKMAKKTKWGWNPSTYVLVTGTAIKNKLST